MGKPIKAGATPRLRFPEFREAGSWTDARLGDLFSERQETGYPSLPLLSVTEADGVVPQEQTNRRNLSAADKSRYLRVVPGDIAYNTMRMWEGRSARVVREGVISPAYTVCVPGGTADSRFFSYYFKTQTLIRRFRQLSQGLVKDTLNLKYDAFSRIQASVPDAEEQRKIADCLTSLDAVIAAQARKVEALKAHKRGLMQQLFPREGDTVPRLRFPEFDGAAGWQLGALRSVAMMKAGSFVPASDIAEMPDADLFPCYGGNGLRGYTTSFTHAGRYVLIGRQGALCGNVMLADGQFHATEHAVVVTSARHVDTDWLYYALDHLELNQYATGQAQPGLSVTALEQVAVVVPQASEQRRIAELLASVDAGVAAESEKLAAIRSHKVGLMQQLFPSLDAD